MTSIRLIADDLTGAIDGGGPFAGRGLSTALCLPIRPGPVGPPDLDAQVMVASTGSRRLTAATAVLRVAEHLHQHPVAPGTLLIKKIDSMLRGPYAHELAALMERTQRRTAVICPALPRMTRWLREGRLWSDGREVRDGERIAGETSTALQTALGAAFPGWPLRWAQARGPREGLLIADAASDEGLDQWVAEFWPIRHQVVWVGSSGLTAALARRLGGVQAPVASVPPNPSRRLLIVIGSRTERVQAEVAVLLSAATWQPVVMGASGSALRCFEHGDITLLMTPEQDVGSDAATALLADCALQAIRASTPDVVVVGGETMAALVGALDPEHAQVLGPTFAGFERMALRSRSCGADLRVWSRSGGFGEPGDLWTLCTAGRSSQPSS